MKSQRFVLIALLVINLGYFAWTRGQLAMIGMLPASFAEHEPQRMSQQVRPGALQILKEPLAAAVPAPPRPLELAPTPTAMPDPESR